MNSEQRAALMLALREDVGLQEAVADALFAAVGRRTLNLKAPSTPSTGSGTGSGTGVGPCGATAEDVVDRLPEPVPAMGEDPFERV